jgi:hypothetical protein
MGSAQSYVSSELVGTALTGLVIAGAVAVGITCVSSSGHISPNDESISGDTSISKGKKKRKTKGSVSSAVTSGELLVAQVADLSVIIPGQFDDRHVIQDSSAVENVVPKAKKPKRRKTKNTEDAKNLIPSDYQSESSVQTMPMSRTIKRSPQPQTPEVTSGPELLTSGTLHATISLDTDDSWTRVGSRRGRQPSALRPSGESQSDVGFTTSQKDEFSPVRNAVEDDPHDSFLLQQSMLPSSSRNLENRKTLAEKMLPKPRKTRVDE